MNAPSLFSSKDQSSMYRDTQWLKRFDLIIDKNLGNLYLNNEMLAKQLGISERQFSRKVKMLSELTPQKYILRYRLRKSMIALKSGIHSTVKEAAFAIGYSKAVSYTTQFFKEYGKTSLQVLQQYGWRRKKINSQKMNGSFKEFFYHSEHITYH